MEQVALTSLLVDLPMPSDVWVGMTYDVSTQTYNWIDKQPVTYTSWFNKKPDPRVGSYVKIGVGNGLREAFWFPASKSEKHPHICKKYPGNYFVIFVLLHLFEIISFLWNDFVANTSRVQIFALERFKNSNFVQPISAIGEFSSKFTKLIFPISSIFSP